jgi:hypothetical protein
LILPGVIFGLLIIYNSLYRRELEYACDAPLNRGVSLLELDRLLVINPGPHDYPIAEKIQALPLSEIGKPGAKQLFHVKVGQASVSATVLLPTIFAKDFLHFT